jgi:methionyl-tRNA formyltransferase
MMKVVVMTAVQSGLDILNMIKDKVTINGVIGLSSQHENVSGYVNIESYCSENGFNFIGIDSYSLTDQNDKNKLQNLEIDVLLVLGWQRLIPDWLIKQSKFAALGGHGSARGITAGRGRSPQNWALLFGQGKFIISLFRIDKGVDSGNLLSEREFEYDCFDDIKTSYYKVGWLMSDMIVELLLEKNENRFLGTPQNDEARYLPKRTADDGFIDWNRSNTELHNFIRALTKPYPGAMTTSDKDDVITIWNATPFRIPIKIDSFSNGQIVQVLGRNYDFVVKCEEGLLLIRDWAANTNWHPCCGDILQSQEFYSQMSTIVERHKGINPLLTLASEFENWNN